MLMTIPLTIWSTRNSIERTACSAAISMPDTRAASSPSARLWVTKAAAKPTKAVVSMMPSSAMLVTPERSHMIPPSAASTRGVAATTVAVARLTSWAFWNQAPIVATTLRDPLARRRGRESPLADADGGRGRLPEPQDPADQQRRGHEHDHRRLDDRDQVGRDLRLQLH